MTQYDKNKTVLERIHSSYGGLYSSSGTYSVAAAKIEGLALSKKKKSKMRKELEYWAKLLRMAATIITYIEQE